MTGDAKGPKVLSVSGVTLPVVIKRHARARRITLRLDHSGEAISVVLPYGVPEGEGLAFAEKQKHWIGTRLARVPPRVPFAPGSRLPILGHDYEIRHATHGRRGVWCEEDLLWVSGRPEHLSRRIADYLKQQARSVIAAKAQEKAASIGARLGRVSIRDTKSRWGSCSAKGDVNFSWRLILAPESVLDYVVAHEVAHLIEHNHSPRFWTLNAQLTADLDAAKAWLRAHGSGLQRYG